MNAASILQELKALGQESIKKVLLQHGAREPFYGVKVEDLKKIQKRIKKNHPLSLALYDTGVSDAMYLAGLIADPKQMSKEALQHWAANAYWSMISEYTVAGVTAESKYAIELALEWIASGTPAIAAAGWSTLSNYASITPDEAIDKNLYQHLLEKVAKEIATAPNRVRYTMNGFIIATGSFIPALTASAIATAQKIGKVTVEMGGTACKVPFAPEYIKKVQDKGYIGRKRKTAIC